MNPKSTLPGLLAQAAAQFGDQAAVDDAGDVISYRALAARVGKLASEIIARGVTTGDRVGVLLPKSITAVCSQYGAMWAGAAYVPFDVAAPVERHRFMMQNCGMRLLITHSRIFSSLGDLSDTPLKHVILVDESPVEFGSQKISISRLDEVWQREALDSPVTLEEDQLAYILHTSGSTGTPKGVMISHANAMAFVEWARKTIEVVQTDRVSSHASFHFDLSVFDLYTACSAGATVVLVPSMVALFPARLAEWIESSGITVWYSVPSALVQMMDDGKLERLAFSRLRKMLFAGEVFAAKYLKLWMQKLPGADWYNLYGPTETNVCTYYPVCDTPHDNVPVPIGIAASGDTILLRDESGKLIDRPGEEGEIWVDGPTVAMGYWGDEEKSSEAFIAEPSLTGHARKLYRTGDYALWDVSGNLIFKGRRDHMIKCRGFRIELGEIEAVAYEHPAIREVCIVAIPHPKIGNIIRACIVRDSGSDLGREEFVNHLSRRLPRYMIPQEINFLDALPKTSTGKIDRQSLAAAS